VGSNDTGGAEGLVDCRLTLETMVYGGREREGGMKKNHVGLPKLRRGVARP